MTTIVKHRRTGNEYILLGINGEANRANPSRFISELFNQEKPEVSCSATVCDVRGNMFLAYIDDLIVVEVDGVKPADILPPPSYEPDSVTENNSVSEERNFSQSESREYDDREFDEDEFDDEEGFEEELEQKLASQSEAEPKPTQATVANSLDAPSQGNSEDEDWI